MSKPQPQWIRDGTVIKKEFVFKDFKQAMKFMSEAGGVVDEMNHHPEWTNVYNTVRVVLTTRDEGGVTNKDLELAKQMDAIADSIADSIAD